MLRAAALCLGAAAAVACSGDDGGGQTGTSSAATGTGTDTGTPSSTATRDAGDDQDESTAPANTSTSTDDGPMSTTGMACPPGTLDCPCSVKMQCEPDLMCIGQLCVDEASTETTESLPPGCANGAPDPGETCYGEAILFATGSEPTAIIIADVDGDD
ncbi:MAG: hypothetical protein JKY37_29840, partial [Nannocystaceae bacterium]|nr:hypothetical protein [Nannocystaceae bacterium]